MLEFGDDLSTQRAKEQFKSLMLSLKEASKELIRQFDAWEISQAVLEVQMMKMGIFPHQLREIVASRPPKPTNTPDIVENSEPNPNYKNAPIRFATMTRDGCYTYDDGKWFQLRGVDDETGETIFAEVDESQVPEFFKRLKP